MASARSSKGLDLVNVFMADVKDGVGVYLSVYLLTEHKWDPSLIGIVVAIPWVVSIFAQSPVGAFIDNTLKKRLLLVIASAIVALSCITVVVLPHLVPIVLSQVALGIVQTIFPPCVAAISLGMVGHQHLSRRIGRNEGFNHFGNMLAAIVAIFLGWYVSFEGIFYFSLFQCAFIIGSTLMIKESDIDHHLARGSTDHGPLQKSSLADIKGLFSDRNILFFTICICLWNVANGAVLPLLGQKIGVTDVKNSALYLSICIIIAQAVMVVVAPIAAKKAEFGRKNLLFIAFLLVPVRAILFSLFENNYLLISLQVIDGLGAGLYGVTLILMMADLSKGTGHFNLLQGTTYAAIGIGYAVSSVVAGVVVKYFGYNTAFVTLAAICVFATIIFSLVIRESHPQSLRKLKGVVV